MNPKALTRPRNRGNLRLRRDGSSDTEISGATGSSYELTDADVGKRIKVRVSFEDDAGNDESLTSSATDEVTAAATQDPRTASFTNVPDEHDGNNTHGQDLRVEPDRCPPRRISAREAGSETEPKAMDSKLLWTNEGWVLDDAGNLVMTSYVDLRAPASRTTIETLVKGCRRQHALEDTERILVSPVQRFRDEGESLIRDEQEGLATEKTETVKPETREEAFRRQRAADLTEAMELLDSGVRMTSRATNRRVSTSSKRLTFGKEWWIFSTAIKPETEEEWEALRAALDPAYDHESEIGQPATFAEALGRMVTEQLGPQSGDNWKQGSIGKGKTVRTKHPSQWILHGPVVYADRLYDMLTRDGDEATRLAASIFTKSATHAAQREYRFAILCKRTVTENAFLTISGMMRDALQPKTLGLVRPAPRRHETPAKKEGVFRRICGQNGGLVVPRQTHSVRVCSPPSRRVAPPPLRGATAWTPAPRTRVPALVVLLKEVWVS